MSKSPNSESPASHDNPAGDVSLTEDDLDAVSGGGAYPTEGCTGESPCTDSCTYTCTGTT